MIFENLRLGWCKNRVDRKKCVPNINMPKKEQENKNTNNISNGNGIKSIKFSKTVITIVKGGIRLSLTY